MQVLKKVEGNLILFNGFLLIFCETINFRLTSFLETWRMYVHVTKYHWIQFIIFKDFPKLHNESKDRLKNKNKSR